jgi:hypothetical protein
MRETRFAWDDGSRLDKTYFSRPQLTQIVLS